MWLCFFLVKIEESLNQAGAHPTLIERKLKIILIKLCIKKYRSNIIKNQSTLYAMFIVLVPRRKIV